MAELNNILLTEEQVIHLNNKLQNLNPQEIILWAYYTFPRLYQTSSFGMTGMAMIDMISKIDCDMISKIDCDKPHPIDLIFIDTLHNFGDTYKLIADAEKKYHLKIHIYKPFNVASESEFTEVYGNKLWETNEIFYDFLVKIEPTYRAYRELNATAVLTGRRKSQGDARKNLEIVEVEKSSNIIKINPFCMWSFKQVKNYIDEYNVPYNKLLDLGYISIGDWHSSSPIEEGDGERSGRWKGKAKTECGMHQLSKFSKKSEHLIPL